MKLEVGMYVRTKEGLIGKIIEIDDDYYTFDNCIYKSFGEYYDACSLEDIYITKASHNLLGNDKEPCLIEVGDLVQLEDRGNTIYEVVRTHDGKLAIKDIYWDEYEELDNEIQEIKSIVTKEQFESMSYKVG